MVPGFCIGVLSSLAYTLLPEFSKMTCGPPIPGTLMPWEEEGGKDRKQGQRFKVKDLRDVQSYLFKAFLEAPPRDFYLHFTDYFRS